MSGIFNHGEFEESMPRQLRQWLTTRNGNVAVKTGNIAVFDVRHCCNHLVMFLLLSINPRFAIGISILSQFERCKYFQFHGCFQLLVIVAVSWEHYFPARRGRKPQVYQRNLDNIYHTFGDRSISGSGCHIAFHGRLSSQSFRDTVLSSLWLILPGLPLKIFFVILVKHFWALLPPSATGTHKIEAQYVGLKNWYRNTILFKFLVIYEVYTEYELDKLLNCCIVQKAPDYKLLHFDIIC